MSVLSTHTNVIRTATTPSAPIPAAAITMVGIWIAMAEDAMVRLGEV